MYSRDCLIRVGRHSEITSLVIDCLLMDRLIMLTSFLPLKVLRRLLHQCIFRLCLLEISSYISHDSLFLVRCLKLNPLTGEAVISRLGGMLVFKISL